MIRRLLHAVFSLSLSLLVLFSTLSLTVEKHYCGTTLIDVSIFTEVHKCAMEASETKQQRIKNRKCCKDVVEVVEGQDELIIASFDDLDLKSQLLVLSFGQSNFLLQRLPRQIVPHKEYIPPSLIYDIQLLDDVFLI